MWIKWLCGVRLWWTFGSHALQFAAQGKAQGVPHVMWRPCKGLDSHRSHRPQCGTTLRRFRGLLLDIYRATTRFTRSSIWRRPTRIPDSRLLSSAVHFGFSDFWRRLPGCVCFVCVLCPLVSDQASLVLCAAVLPRIIATTSASSPRDLVDSKLPIPVCDKLCLPGLSMIYSRHGVSTAKTTLL